MIHKLKEILSGVSEIMNGILGGIAHGMIYGNTVNCNGGGVVIREALY